MHKKIAIDASYPNETRVVLLDQKGRIEEIEYETATKSQIKANLYLAKIARVEPSLQAVFIEYGAEKSGFLPFSEIHPDYWNLPAEDKAKLKMGTSRKLTPLELEETTDSDTIDNTNTEELISIETNEDDIEHTDSDIQDIYKEYQVQEVIKKGQVLLVQAQKEERGNKGASFTTYISLAGKYCVLMPNRPNHNGISRRISNGVERKRLRTIVNQVTEGDNKNAASVIIRTAGIGRTDNDIKRDYDYLIRLWNNIRDVTLKSKAPTFIHAEDDIIKQTIRDLFDHNKVKEIIVQGEIGYKRSVDFMQTILPAEVKKLVHYKSATPLFTKFNIEDQLVNLYQPIVSLPSGGYVVINPTEALTAVDVNSGKATAERNIEETATKTNIEAAQEIAKQMKLRDISGLVVLDFIDMYDDSNKRKVEKAFRDALTHDKARIQLGNISSFGLLEMSRQRLKPSFLESNTNMCHHCHGKGLVRSDESNAMLIFRTIANEITTHKSKSRISVLSTFASNKAVAHILNYKREEIAYLEKRFKLKLNFYSDHLATADSFSIEKTLSNKSAKQETTLQPAFKPDSKLFLDDDTTEPIKEIQEKPKQRRSRNKKDDTKSIETATENVTETESNTETIATPETKPSRNNARTRVRRKATNPSLKAVEDSQNEG